eukprot:gene30370-37573_t
MDMVEWLKIHPDLLPQDGEVTVTKRRVSAFTGSDLEVILRAYDVRHLILTGFSTGGVVLSTVCEATDKDFRLTVLSDGVADPDTEMHNILVTKYFPKRADVLSVDQPLCCNSSLSEFVTSGVPGAIKEVPDADGRRVEIVCSKCDSHLGHVFKGEGFNNPTDERHCVNGICLNYEAAK